MAIPDESISADAEKERHQAKYVQKGQLLDNAIIENFFGIIKSELFYLKKDHEIDELKRDIKNYIE
ncbi:IS3 family transposase [Sphingobacterium sp. T2]|uniref:IS3 family transposase n=1 Tax=Sphingobacterium sp. T2 TaxID=1590596 RepID=UPI0009E542D7